MQYLFQLGVAVAFIGVLAVIFAAQILKSPKYISRGFGLMALGVGMMTIGLKEYMSQWMLIAFVLAIGYLIFVAGYKYWKSIKQEKGGVDREEI